MNLERIKLYRETQQKAQIIYNRIETSKQLWGECMKLPKCTGERHTFHSNHKDKMFRCSLEGTNLLYELIQTMDYLELSEPEVMDIPLSTFIEDFEAFFE